MIDHRWLAGTAALVILTGCGPVAASVPSPTATSTVTGTGTPSASTTPTTTTSPTQAMSKDQKAALDALNAVDAVYGKIGRNPSAYTEKQIRDRLGKVAMKPLLTNMIDSMLRLKKAGYRQTGDVKILSIKVGDVQSVDKGLRVVITRCRDQRGLVVVDKSGEMAPASWQYPEWHLQEAALRKPANSGWLQAGTRPASTKKCG